MEKESAGARLKRLRLQKGLSLQEVHRHTKIHINILKAIEEDSLTSISPVYIKGFLKIYCKFLGVDPKDYIPDYREPQATVTISSQPQTEKITVSFVKDASRWLAYFKRFFYLIKTVVIILLSLLVFFVLFRLEKIVASKQRSLKSKPKKAISALVKKEEQKIEEIKRIKSSPTLTSSQKSEISKSSEMSRPQEIQVQSDIRLTIRAKDDCWIQVKTDGKIIFQGILKKGRSENWQAKEKIDLALGNAGAVELEINGNLFSNLGRKGQALKNISITKEGLVIGR
ncbi:MAG: DUF4115 domain-containing protein [Candidatus Omnitrophica bacterium]|nr:DUF4115 domain-containing protein [Candidatus Omnitrophota bacterium]